MAIVCFLLSSLLNAEQPGNADPRETRQHEVVRKLPLESIALFDQPYLPGADTKAALAANQTLDLYVPPGPGPFPLIVWIHGGGWHSGNKNTGAAPLFLKAGFALASLDYRLIQDNAPFPAQIEDCLSALAWLRQNAPHYRIDPGQIGVIGHSAGAHLAALIATIGGTALFSPTHNVAPRVQAAVLWSGPLDLGRERGQWPRSAFPWNPSDPFCRMFFPGGSYDEAFAQWASPASYVTASAPPMLIVHGAKDTTVPDGQAVAFAESLKRQGVPATFRSEPESNHNIVTLQNFQEALGFFSSILKNH
ncbi:MAG: alpha/beta fold hydrolase [Chthoniobacteraceae bacterium]